MARKKKEEPVLTAEELEELEGIEEELEVEDEELEDVEEVDEDEETDEDDVEEEEEEEPEEELEFEEDEEVEEKPKPKAKKKRTPPGNRLGEGELGTAEIAHAAGVDGRTLRMYLRKNKIPKVDGRYRWGTMDDPDVKKLIKDVKGGAAKEARDEALRELKDRKTKKTSEAGTPKKKVKRTKAQT